MIHERYAHPHFDLVPLGSLTKIVQYGTSERCTSEPTGVPVLRIPNLQADGWDLSDLKYLPLTPEELSTYRLEKGDILFNRTNGSRELVGKCEVFDFDGDWVFASYLIRLRIDNARAFPEFVTAFLNTFWGRRQVEHVSRQILMSNINTEEIRALRIPLPKPPKQRELLARLADARAARRQKLQQADHMLTSLDGFVLGAIGLTLPPADDRMVYAARLSDARQRLDANYHTPRFRELQRRLQHLHAVPLSTLRRFSTERVDPRTGIGATFRYIEISSVSSETGEASAVDTRRLEAPSRARMVVHAGNILLSLTRPQRGSIALIDDSLDGCIASTGFAVLTDMETDQVKTSYTSYLWAFLRTEAARLQMLQRSSGGNYPAITEDELRCLLVPVPHGNIQERVAAEVAHRRDAARELRGEAIRLWDDAKRRFEEELLGPDRNEQEPKTNQTRRRGRR
jgi:restriction endonuclease S subunit